MTMPDSLSGYRNDILHENIFLKALKNSDSGIFFQFKSLINKNLGKTINDTLQVVTLP